MRMRTEINKFVIILVLIILTINITAAAPVESINPEKLPAQLHEGEQVDYTIKIGDYDDDTKSITIETSLISSNNKPIYDFGDLNPTINVNRDSQIITISTSRLPKTFQVSIAGKAPEGWTTIKSDKTELIVTKFSDTKLKYYEVRTNKKLLGIEPFELIINKKKTFDDTMEQIIRPELGGVKKEVRKLFNKGLVTEAQDLIAEINSIKWPNSLLLFGIMKIDSNTWLNIITIVILCIGLFIGFLIGSNIDTNKEE